MSKNEIVNVLTIKTEQSQQTIKGLKKEISDLKKTLDNATIGSEQFEQASKELAQAQNTLKTAMSGQKQEVTALEGSYDALVAEMAKLKKEWRATADEAKRNSLGVEIEKINTQLKDLDNTIGNNQRLVGSYAEEFKKALAEQDDATITTRTRLESLQKVASGLASGYAAVQGAMTLLNIENENLQKAMVKVQSAMAIAQGIGGMKDLVEGVSRAKVAFAGATNGVKMFVKGLGAVKGAIAATGIGILVTILGTLIANWDKVVKAFRGGLDPVEKTADAMERLNNAIKDNKEKSEQLKSETLIKYAQNIAGAEGDIKKIRKELEKLNAEEEKNIQLGFEMDIQSAKDEVAKTEKRIEEAEEKLKKLNERFEQSSSYDQYSTSEYSGVNTGQIGLQIGSVEDAVAELKKTLTEQKKAVEKYEQEYDKYKANKIIEDAKNKVEEDEKTTTTITNNQIKAAEETANKQKEIDEELRLSKLNEEEKLIDALDKKYIEYMKVYEGNQEKQLEILEWYTDEYTKIVEKGLDEEIKAQQKAAEEKEKLTKEEYEKKVAASEKRLNNSIQGIERGAETQTYLNERKKPKGNGEINAIDNELSKLETLKSITEETMNLKIAAIDAEMALFEESSERWKELEEQKILVREQANRTLNELDEQLVEQTKAKQRALAGSITNTFTSALSSASQIISSIQEDINTTNEQGFEKNKKMQIANATIQMLVGITSALAGAFTTKSGPWDIALAAVQAATIATTGGIQIANIKKQTFDGGGGDVSAGATPTALMSATDIPVSYTRNLMGDAETEEMNKAQQVYILESDIQDSSRKVEVREQNTNF